MTKTFTRIVVIAIIATLGFSSCKKNYTCACTTTAGSAYNSEIKTTKKKAEAFCSDQQTSTRTCVLK